MTRSILLVICIFCIFILAAPYAEAKIPMVDALTKHFSEGQWRGELSTTSMFGTRQFAERRNDWMLIGMVDYEWPVAKRLTMSLRGYPLFLYYLDENKRGDKDYIYGGGLGIAGRIYQDIEMRKGWYMDVGCVPILQSEDFKRNSSRFNFVFNAGAGYQFENGITINAKYYHISNANLSEDNIGLDLFAVGVGWRF